MIEPSGRKLAGIFAILLLIALWALLIASASGVIGGWPVLLVPVAAILVAGIRLHCLDTERLLRDGGPRRIACAVPVAKGAEMGWFEHGSTILVFAPPGFALSVTEGEQVRAGVPLMRLPGTDAGSVRRGGLRVVR